MFVYKTKVPLLFYTIFFILKRYFLFKALEENIEAVVFDRGGFIYHGVVKELAEAAREAGLKF